MRPMFPYRVDALPRALRGTGDTWTNRDGTPVKINEGAIDRWTLAHIGSGVGLNLLGVPLWGTVMLSIGFEVVENIIQPSIPSMFQGTADADSMANSFFDNWALVLGWVVTEAVK